MVQIQDLAELYGNVLALARYHLPAEFLPVHTNWWAAVALPVGFALAMWGARLLRTIFVLAFIVIGAAIGIQIARGRGVDVLFGLFIGAGFAALVGHLLFRWWVGVVSGCVAMLILVMVQAPQINTTIGSAVTRLTDYQTGVGTGVFELRPENEAPVRDSGAYLGSLWAFLLENDRDLLYRAGFMLGLSALLGLAFGILLPRLTMIVGTSLVGTVVLVTGLSVLLSSLWPAAWAVATANPSWCLGAIGVFLVGSMLHQARRKPLVPAAPAATPATA